MISLKPGISIDGVKPETIMGLIIVASVLHEHGHGTVVTAGTDGKHMTKSLHYEGFALDIRSKHIEKTEDKIEVLATCKRALGVNFDILIENVGTDIEHFHLEYQPKG